MKINKVIILLFLLLIVVGCSNKLEKEVTLTGEVITKEIMKNSKPYKVSVLALDNPLVISGVAVNSVMLNSSLEIADKKVVTIKGNIEENEDPNIDLKYALKVKQIEE